MKEQRESLRTYSSASKSRMQTPVGSVYSETKLLSETRRSKHNTSICIQSQPILNERKPDPSLVSNRVTSLQQIKSVNSLSFQEKQKQLRIQSLMKIAQYDSTCTEGSRLSVTSRDSFGWKEPSTKNKKTAKPQFSEYDFMATTNVVNLVQKRDSYHRKPSIHSRNRSLSLHKNQKALLSKLQRKNSKAPAKKPPSATWLSERKRRRESSLGSSKTTRECSTKVLLTPALGLPPRKINKERFLRSNQEGLKISDYNSTNMPKQDVINLLVPEFYSEEVFFQLTHEVNKVFFWLQTVRKIFNHQHAHSLVDLFLKFGCALVAMARVRVASMIGQLFQGKRLLNIARLGEFLKSKFQTQILDRLYRARNLCARMESSVKRCFRFMYYIKKLKLDALFSLSEISPSQFAELRKDFLSFFWENYSNREYLRAQE